MNSLPRRSAIGTADRIAATPRAIVVFGLRSATNTKGL
jgi:hypothetical protein